MAYYTFSESPHLVERRETFLFEIGQLLAMLLPKNYFRVWPPRPKNIFGHKSFKSWPISKRKISRRSTK